MINLEITHSDGDRKITLSAKTMKELIDEKLPKWLPLFKDDLSLLKQTKSYKLYGEDIITKVEKESGWYYDL